MSASQALLLLCILLCTFGGASQGRNDHGVGSYVVHTDSTITLFLVSSYFPKSWRRCPHIISPSVVVYPFHFRITGVAVEKRCGVSEKCQSSRQKSAASDSSRFVTLYSKNHPPLTLEYLGGGLGQKFLRNIPPDHVEYTPPTSFGSQKNTWWGGTLGGGYAGIFLGGGRGVTPPFLEHSKFYPPLKGGDF